MSDYFSRLTKPISEQEKLDILMHNIRPCYANVLAVNPDSINSVEKLRTLCRNYESVQSLTSQYKEPPRATSNTLAPDLAFNNKQNINHNKNNSFNKPYNYKFNYSKNFYQSKPGNTSTSQTKPVNAVDQISRPVPFLCPRCRTNEHSLRQCNKERFPICFKCGKRGVKFPNCTDCQPVDKTNDSPTNNKSKN